MAKKPNVAKRKVGKTTKNRKIVTVTPKCLMCNTTGETCSVCGDAVNACACDGGPCNQPCENCGGNRRVEVREITKPTTKPKRGGGR
jgi:hypothetical protein